MNSPPEIDWNNLSQVQEEITRWAQERFPHRTDHHAIYKLMVEEIPELAMHKKEHGTEGIGPELADCFILLADLASLWKIDMAHAIFQKMQINYNRAWVMDTNGIMQHVPVQDDSAPPAVEMPSCCPQPDCRGLSKNIERAPASSVFLYRCNLCGWNFDDDIPF